MLLDRDELISILFRETDRAQRMKTSLSLIHCGICDWQKWQSELGQASCEAAVNAIAARITRLLRCYDSVGKIADGELVLILPGCNNSNAAKMAERLHTEVFGSSVFSGQNQLTLTACFGIATSGGRSPMVVLREAERALAAARTRGTGAVGRYAADGEASTLSRTSPGGGVAWINWVR